MSVLVWPVEGIDISSTMLHHCLLWRKIVQVEKPLGDPLIEGKTSCGTKVMDDSDVSMDHLIGKEASREATAMKESVTSRDLRIGRKSISSALGNHDEISHEELLDPALLKILKDPILFSPLNN